MRTLTVLLYKAGKDGKWIDNAIAFWTGLHPSNWGAGPYAHAEIMDVTGMCYTSTMGQLRQNPLGKNNGGVVRRPAAQVLKHPGRWDCVRIQVPGETYRLVIRFLNYHLCRSYDRRAILSFFLPFRIHKKDAYICSEIVQNALCVAKVFEAPAVPSPRKLARQLVKERENGNEHIGPVEAYMEITCGP